MLPQPYLLGYRFRRYLYVAHVADRLPEEALAMARTREALMRLAETEAR